MMIVILERVSPGLRGVLTRWLLEPQSGVFVGTTSTLVREKLWSEICSKTGNGGAMLFHSTDSEQGFAIQFWGTPNRKIVDYEGLSLVTIPHEGM